MSQPVGSMKVNNNFLKDFIIAIAVAAVSTVIFLAIICVISQCAPRWFGRVRRREQWLAPTLEEGYQEVSQPDLPLTVKPQEVFDLSLAQLRRNMGLLPEHFQKPRVVFHVDYADVGRPGFEQHGDGRAPLR
ncbi:hypothetical protein F4774DRAFT_412771 [Daldinia eschscholtzii]|nr:hypothetical protein F4774DRAFT_412771 [Daldinia eschscholtzii]